jgi:hypothetical protein
MSNSPVIKLIAASLLIIGMAASAAAQKVCREGRAANGQCVDAPLAFSLRERANLMSQQKISVTAYPILPSQDYSYPRPVDAQRFELSQPGNFSTNPFPRSP